MSSPWLMAPLGHSGSQAPQLMHSSVIVVAIALLFGSLARAGSTGLPSFTGVQSAESRRTGRRHRRQASFPKGDSRPPRSCCRRLAIVRAPAPPRDPAPVLVDLGADAPEGPDAGEEQGRAHQA